MTLKEKDQQEKRLANLPLCSALWHFSSVCYLYSCVSTCAADNYLYGSIYREELVFRGMRPAVCRPTARIVARSWLLKLFMASFIALHLNGRRATRLVGCLIRTFPRRDFFMEICVY
ncbi:hypothetical protein ANTPLA_LOCUS2578 [Anthophora plagiata]